MQTIIIAITVISLILISVYTIIKMKELSSITKIMINTLFWATGAMGLIILGKMLNAENFIESVVFGLIIIANIAIVSYITKLIITSNRNKLSAQA